MSTASVDRFSPRPVFCVIDDVYRNVRTADLVVSGRFDHAGETLDMGTSPDWLSPDLPVDEEWRIEWSKFYYGLDLAHAYGEGEGEGERFLETWIELVLSWIGQVPPDHDTPDVIARRIQNWTYAWNRFAASPGFTGLPTGVAEKILASIEAQLIHLRRNLSIERNHRTLELYALFICALAHPEIDPDGELIEFATHELYRNLCVDILPDGVHRELSSHYHAIVLRSFLGVRVNARLFALPLPTGFDPRLESACEFLAHVTAPDGSLPMLSDSDDGDYSDLLLIAARELGRDDFRYVATSGKQGHPPADISRSFPDAGYYIQRSGWGVGSVPYEDECQLVLDSGQLGTSGHAHYDALHIEVSAGGHRLLVDPGRYTYSEAGQVNWRHWFKGTEAHNTLTVDGLDQTPYKRGKPKGPVAHARLIERSDGPGVASLVGEVVSPAYDAIHRRRIIFVAGEWWIVEDFVTAHQLHRYDLRFHLAPRANDRVAPVGTSGVSAPGISLLFADAQPGDVTIEPGWVASSYGVRTPAPVVVQTRCGVATTRFVTAVVPTLPGDVSPTLTMTGDTTLELCRGNVVDAVSWDTAAIDWHRSQ